MLLSVCKAKSPIMDIMKEVNYNGIVMPSKITWLLVKKTKIKELISLGKQID